MAFKQLVPEHNVTIFGGVVKVRVKHFPSVFLAANTASGLILGTDTALVLAWAGFLVSWIYLRFYKPQQDLGQDPYSRGDASETFTFASFWPDMAQPVIVSVADRLYRLALVLHLIRPFSTLDIEASRAQAPPDAQHQKSVRRDEEVERRRALALKALDERLKEVTTKTKAAVPVAAQSFSQNSDSSPREASS